MAYSKILEWLKLKGSAFLWISPLALAWCDKLEVSTFNYLTSSSFLMRFLKKSSKI
jgi:hypothetical protein